MLKILCIGVAGETGPTGASGETGPIGSGLFGGAYSAATLATQIIGTSYNGLIFVSDATLLPGSTIATAGFGMSLSAGAGVYELSFYFYAGTASVDATLTLDLFLNGINPVGTQTLIVPVTTDGPNNFSGTFLYESPGGDTSLRVAAKADVVVTLNLGMSAEAGAEQSVMFIKKLT